jgi:hypothetical protein
VLRGLQDLLARPCLDSASAPQVVRTLQQGPWCWPVNADLLKHARGLVPAGPPPLRPGQTILVTESPGYSDLWALEAGLGAAPPDADALRFGSKAAASWDLAVVTLPRALPVLWSSVRRYHDAWLRAVHLVLLPTPASSLAPAPAASRASRERLLDGPSFGLSFLLALASLVLEEALPGDLAASGGLHPSGRVDEVGGLEGKIEVLAREAPGVRRLLVAASQEGLARAAVAAVGAPFQVIGVASAARAIDVALGPALVDRLVEAGSDGEQRRELVDAFFRLALQGRGQAVDWSPVARAAALARDRWEGLGGEDRRRLEFARAVALRHEYNEGRMPMPESTWLGALPASLRLAIVANYVQQSADTGEPEPALVIQEALRHLVRGREAFAPHLRLLGALGRLLAVTGEPARALEYQMEAAAGFLERLERDDVSFPLAEWYRLAGALGDRARFDGAETVRRTVEAQGGFATGQPYVELARAKGLVALGGGEGKDPEETLDRLGTDDTVPSHVRWSAVRWHVRLLEEGDRDVPAVLARFDIAAARGEAEELRARPFRVLVDLDRAARRRDAAMGAAALAELARLQPGLAGHLFRAAPSRQEVETVARLFPY